MISVNRSDPGDKRQPRGVQPEGLSVARYGPVANGKERCKAGIPVDSL